MSEPEQNASLQETRHEAGRGRSADRPSDIPKAGWLDVLSRTKDGISSNNLSVVAAGIGFYGFLAVVPALGALIGLYGLFASPGTVSEHIAVLARIVPGEVLPLLRQQMTRIVSHQHAAGISAILGIVISLASSTSATSAVLTGLNIAYGEREKRSYPKFLALALLFTFLSVLGALIAVTLVAVLPAAIDHLPIGGLGKLLARAVRWPVLIGAFLLALAILYTYGPSRRQPKWRWITWGAVTAAVLWIIASAGFSLYVSLVGSYDRTYGSIGAVAVFMMWLYLTAFVVLVGAQLNAELERQTVKDSTEGRPKPLGRRGAWAADTVGPSRGSAKTANSP